MLFTFPEDTRWNAEHQAVEFGVEIGEYRGLVRVPRRARAAHTRAVSGGVLSPADPVREHCRAEAAPGAS
jgi:hypothetical protein